MDGYGHFMNLLFCMSSLAFHMHRQKKIYEKLTTIHVDAVHFKPLLD